MTAIVSGIIIDTFGLLREMEEEKNKDIQEKCFICNLSKYEPTLLLKLTILKGKYLIDKLILDMISIHISRMIITCGIMSSLLLSSEIKMKLNIQELNLTFMKDWKI